MKDFIVMIAILILGLVIAGLVLGFKGKMQSVSNAGTTALDTLTSQLTVS